jgi:hypothetical protein
MALPTTGALSLDAIHIEAGGTSGTLCSINDADIRGLIGKASSTSMGFNEWYGASADSPIVATGGSISTSGNTKYHTFTSNGTFTVTAIAEGSFSNTISLFLLGGGGRGGSQAGGGGGGGIAQSTGSFQADIVILGPGTNYSVTVGAGTAGLFVATEAANNTFGGTSSFVVPGITTYSSGGGGNGASRTVLQANQPQGGDTGIFTGGAGINGNNPDFGVGGGGAGAAGNGDIWSANGSGNGGLYGPQGGLGVTFNGAQWGGGGGNGSFAATPARRGSGQYGGGNGGSDTNFIATNATNYGGGGGGGGVTSSNPSKSGFQGIVVAYYTYQ